MNMLHITCKNHPNLRWYLKEIAWTPGVGYNGSRNIHFIGEVDTTRPLGTKLCAECPCSAKDLVLVDEVKS